MLTWHSTFDVNDRSNRENIVNRVAEETGRGRADIKGNVLS